jgi:hypothetical protein
VINVSHAAKNQYDRQYRSRCGAGVLAAGVLAPTEGGLRLIPDGVHPGWGGHLLMATHILKGLNALALGRAKNSLPE